jgi:hypothetical protein
MLFGKKLDAPPAPEPEPQPAAATTPAQPTRRARWYANSGGGWGLLLERPMWNDPEYRWYLYASVLPAKRRGWAVILNREEESSQIGPYFSKPEKAKEWLVRHVGCTIVEQEEEVSGRLFDSEESHA